MIEIFKHANYDFLGKKWPFIIASLVLTAAGLASMAMKGGVKWGIDFNGGAVMYVRFNGPPPDAQIRTALAAKIPGSINVQNLALRSGGRIDANSEFDISSTPGMGAGGSINVRAANTVSIAGEGSGLFSKTSSLGPGGPGVTGQDAASAL